MSIIKSTSNLNIGYAVAAGTAGAILTGAAITGGGAVALGMVPLASLVAGMTSLIGLKISDTTIGSVTNHIATNWKLIKSISTISGAANGLTKEPETQGAAYIAGDVGTLKSYINREMWDAFLEVADRMGLRSNGYPTTTVGNLTQNPVFFNTAVSALEERLAKDNTEILAAWQAFKTSRCYNAVVANIGAGNITTFHWSFQFSFVVDTWYVRIDRAAAGVVIPFQTADYPWGELVATTNTRTHPKFALTADNETEIYGFNDSERNANIFYRAGNGWSIEDRHAISDPENIGVTYMWSTSAPGFNPAYEGVTTQDGADVMTELDTTDTYLARIGAELVNIENALTNIGTGAKTDAAAVAVTIPAELTEEIGQTRAKLGEISQSLAEIVSKTAVRAAEATAEPTAPDDPNNTGTTPAVVPLPAVSTDNNIFTVYNPTDAQLRNFGTWLWSGLLDTLETGFLTFLKKMYQSPFDAIISTMDLYAKPVVGTDVVITLGKIQASSETLTCMAAPVNSQYINLEWDALTVPETFYNVYDYDYTTVSIYLPFVGICPIDSADVIGKTLTLHGRVDVLTGTLLYQIEVYDPYSKTTQLQYIFNGNCAVQKPLTGTQQSSIIAGLTAVGGAVAGVVTAGASVPFMAAAGAIGSATAGAIGSAMAPNLRQSGTIGGNAGAMGVKTPYLLITHKTPYDAADYNRFYGYAANKTVKLELCSGFTRVKEIHLEHIPATSAEIDEIEALLKNGVII